ncbi:hypothetical protein [Catenulispora sp. GP43]|uniref:hypothetical protein n=1 Tax=Catenulispora sp. GP43 TaxID=3156263 RepID=UPI0035185F82
MVLTAYVDESMRRRRGEGICFYVLAAVLVDDRDLDDVRDALKSLRRGKAKSIHWRYERPDRQPELAAAIASLPIRPVVAVCLHEIAVASERARRLCLASLLAALDDHAVARVILDSRREQDNNDLKVLQAWRRAGRPEAGVRMDFQDSEAEPALWAPDCVAGAVAWWLNGDGASWCHLEAITQVVDVDL